MSEQEIPATPSEPSFDDKLVDRILALEETHEIDTKRLGDVTSAIKTAVAFANADGGVLVLGIEDSKKAEGRDRVFGLQENPEAADEFRRNLRTRVTPRLAPPDCPSPAFLEVGCTLRDARKGSVLLVRIEKSGAVHSVVDGGTFVRMEKSNRQLSAAEVTELSLQRGATSVISQPVDVAFELLDTEHWRAYAAQRHLTRPIRDAMLHIGLARKTPDGVVQPTRAAVLLFAEDPSGLLDSKASIRIFHYRGDTIEHKAETNLLRPPKTVGGPLIVQIRDALQAILDAIATGVQMGPLGFEIAQRYPVRVLREAITNAVIHRDYRLSSDIHVRIFASRIEVESPGLLPGNLTSASIGGAGSHPRNRALVDHLREFPTPPNLDAGEGVRMMIDTMDKANLYPPVFFTKPDIPKEAVIVYLMNVARPSIWAQVNAYVEKHGEIGNAEVRKIMRTEDPVKASRLLRSWVARGLLVVSKTDAAKQHRRYRRPGAAPGEGLFAEALRKQG